MSLLTIASYFFTAVVFGFGGFLLGYVSGKEEAEDKIAEVIDGVTDKMCDILRRNGGI